MRAARTTALSCAVFVVLITGVVAATSHASRIPRSPARSPVTGVAAATAAPSVVTPEPSRAEAIRAKVGAAGLSWPRVDMITSYFGRRHSGFHHGIDILCSPKGGDPIYAAAGGRVILSQPLPIYGNAVMIGHAGTYDRTLYGHLWRSLVRAGQQVRRGQQVGVCGSTGHSTNPHLHFEVYRMGKIVNPLPLLPAWD